MATFNNHIIATTEQLNRRSPKLPHFRWFSIKKDFSNTLFSRVFDREHCSYGLKKVSMGKVFLPFIETTYLTDTGSDISRVGVILINRCKSSNTIAGLALQTVFFVSEITKSIYIAWNILIYYGKNSSWPANFVF